MHATILSMFDDFAHEKIHVGLCCCSASLCLLNRISWNGSTCRYRIKAVDNDIKTYEIRDQLTVHLKKCEFDVSSKNFRRDVEFFDNNFLSIRPHDLRPATSLAKHKVTR